MRNSCTTPNHTLSVLPSQTLVPLGTPDSWLPGETSVYQISASASTMQTLECLFPGNTVPGQVACGAWVGTGSVFKDFEADAFQSSTGSANLSFVFNTTASSTFGVTYKLHDRDDFCLAPESCIPVPEPSSLLGLVLLGLAGLTGKVSRSKSFPGVSSVGRFSQKN